MSGAPHGTGTADLRVPMLDVLRGLLALAVCVYHLSMWTRLFGPGTRAGTSATLLGIYSVEGFFIISGFCFFHAYRRVALDGSTLREFYARRFLRLAPLFYLAVVLNLALGQEVGPQFHWRKLLENLTLTFGLFHPNHAMVLGGWSVGIEVVFYLAFPLLARMARRPIVLAALCCALAAAAVPWTFTKVQAASDWNRFHAYVQIPNHAFLFLWGAAIAELRRRVSWRIPVSTLALLVGATLLLSIASQPIVVDHVEAMVGLMRVKYVLVTAWFVLLCALTDLGPGREPAKWWLWLGDVSYALYLLHPFAWLAVRTCLQDHKPPAFAFGTTLMLALMMAGAAHRWIEKPLLRWGRRTLAPRSAASVSEPYTLHGGSLKP